MPIFADGSTRTAVAVTNAAHARATVLRGTRTLLFVFTFHSKAYTSQYIADNDDIKIFDHKIGHDVTTLVLF